jgi:hypothetical protein
LVAGLDARILELEEDNKRLSKAANQEAAKALGIKEGDTPGSSLAGDPQASTGDLQIDGEDAPQRLTQEQAVERYTSLLDDLKVDPSRQKQREFERFKADYKQELGFK